MSQAGAFGAVLYISCLCFHAVNKYVLPAVLLLVTLYQ